MEPKAEGTLIAYSIGEGTMASDNSGGNLGLHMTHLLPESDRPTVGLWGAFKNAQASAWEASGRQQFPALYDQVIGKVYLRGAPSVPPRDSTVPTQAPQPPAREVTAVERWEQIKETERPKELREYAREYRVKPGSGVWVKLAELRMQARVRARWADIQGTESVEMLESFVREYGSEPGTAELVLQARSQLEELRERAARMVEATRAALEEARGTGTVAALEAYIRLHGRVPGAAHLVREARERLEELLRPPEWTNSVGMEFVLVPAGEFEMGSTSELADDDERPRTRVRIGEAFWMGKHEVTQGQWKAVMGSNPSWFKHCGRDCPVENVSWKKVQQFFRKLNAMEGGQRYRLPTEAEWEYAARAGSRRDTPAGDLRIAGQRNAPQLDGIAWYGGNGGVRYEGGHDCSGWDEKQYSSDRCGPHPVGGKAPNGLGLHDMLGNVWEWVQDRYGAYPGGAVTDPRGPSAGSGPLAQQWH